MKRLSVTACVLFGAVLAAGMRPIYAQTTGSSSSSTVSSSTAAKKKKKHHGKKEPKQMAPTPDRIEEIQSALASNGYYQGTANGKWDPTTVAALQKFQSDHGLDANGKLDALSLQKLGLGSEIAGVSAPRPVKPAAANPVPSGTPAGAKPQSPKAPDPSGGSTPSAPVAAASAPGAIAPPAAATKPATPPQPQ